MLKSINILDDECDLMILEIILEHLRTWSAYMQGLDKVYILKDIAILAHILEKYE